MLSIGVVAKIQMDLQANPGCTFNRPTLLRSLFTVGLLCKNFDFDSENFGEKKVVEQTDCCSFDMTVLCYFDNFYMFSEVAVLYLVALFCYVD